MGYREYRNKIEAYNRNTYIILIIGALCAGIILFNLVNLPKNASNLLTTFGGGLTAVGIQRYVKKDRILNKFRNDEIKEIVNRWRLLDIQEGRGRTEQEQYRQGINNAREKIHIQALTLSRFRDDLEEEIINADKKGIEIKLLLLNPNSTICKRFGEISSTRDDLPSKIRNSVREFKKLGLDNLEIRYYDDVPINYFRVDGKAFVGPYFGRDRRSSSTITFFGEVTGDMVNQFKENFETCWEAGEPA